MPDFNFLLLYVDDPAPSAAFYADLLGLEPIEMSPTFAMFALPSGLMLGLWSCHTAEPAATPVGGAEIGFQLDDAAAVDAAYANWSEKSGARVAQEPIDLDFGRTFVVLDPDGHRLRVFAPAAE